MSSEKNLDTENSQIKDVSAEVLEHMMHPRNYGEMKDAQGVGMGVDMKTGEFAIIYIHIVDDKINAISFGVNACQDTVVAGSLFTEMIKNDSLENAKKTVILMDKKLESAPKKQQACSRMILRGFDAAVINRQNRINGQNEDMYKINIKESCEIEE